MKKIRKTKIVATLGLASSTQKEIEGLIKAGMNVSRLNFSHGSHDDHEKLFDAVRAASKKLKTPVAILQDLSGPKIRIGDFDTEKVKLKKGGTIILTTEKITGNVEKVSVSYSRLPKEVKVGGHILLDDGKVRLLVSKIHGEEIHCKILAGGEIRGRRGVNVPGANLSISSLTEKDKKDLVFGLKKGVDFMALSFVRSPDDVRELRKLIGNHNVGIISKIETQEAVEAIDEILKESDGIMVARGDLAVEIPAEEVPIAQKMIIKKCNEAGKPVITATQMLESMITTPVPTRAEVNDVANAILDGTDAVMLSAETAVGEHPVLAIETMARVAESIEGSNIYHEGVSRFKRHPQNITDSVSAAVVKTAYNTGAKAIVAFSELGTTARMISRYKPTHPILVLTPIEHTFQRTVLSFGCTPKIIDPIKDVTEAIATARKMLVHEGMAKKGDAFIIAAGVPFGKSGGTNMLLTQVV